MTVRVVSSCCGGVQVVKSTVRVIGGGRGPPGRPGPPGAAGDAYVHTQTSPSSTWTVNHNLGRKPLVSVRRPGGNEVEADILHISDNQLIVNFASNQTGSVRCL